MWQKLVLSTNRLGFGFVFFFLETTQSVQKCQHAVSRYKSVSLHGLKEILGNHSFLNGIEMKGVVSDTLWVLE